MFKFKHIKTPGWAKKDDVYFLVLTEEGEPYAYIGLQDLNFQLGICGNLCYKTLVQHRGEKKSKFYLEEFIKNCPFDFDIIKAVVKESNIASRKMLEHCGFVYTVKKAYPPTGLNHSIPKNSSTLENEYFFRLKKYDY